jgi:hypothetical protein
MTIDGVDRAAAAQLSVMAMEAACQPDSEQTAQRIVDLAAKLIPCAAADIVHHRVRGTLRVSASSDQLISAQLDAAAQRWPHDPYPDALTDAAPVQAAHPAGYLQQAGLSTGVVAELTYSLRVDRSDHGFLRFLVRQPVAQNSAEGELAAAFAAHAAITLDRAALRNTVGNLRDALVTNREIGAAVGILMARSNISYDAGFQLLKQASQNTNRKLRDIVNDVLYTGELPQDRLLRAVGPGRRGAAA